MTKHLFVTGGVVSSLGKGLTAAAVALLLSRRGYRVKMQKLDPYLSAAASMKATKTVNTSAAREA